MPPSFDSSILCTPPCIWLLELPLSSGRQQAGNRFWNACSYSPWKEPREHYMKNRIIIPEVFRIQNMRDSEAPEDFTQKASPDVKGYQVILFFLLRYFDLGQTIATIPLM